MQKRDNNSAIRQFGNSAIRQFGNSAALITPSASIGGSILPNARCLFYEIFPFFTSNFSNIIIERFSKHSETCLKNNSVQRILR